MILQLMSSLAKKNVLLFDDNGDEDDEMIDMLILILIAIFIFITLVFYSFLYCYSCLLL